MENSNVPLEEYRNWLQLPQEITQMFLMKLQTSEILEYAQFVCKSWYNICKEPAMWRTIKIQNENKPMLVVKHEKMLVTAVHRSAGGVLDLSIEGFGTDISCHFIASRCGKLKRLRLGRFRDITSEALIKALGQLTTLEELELTLCSLHYDTISIISACPSLKTLKLNRLGSFFSYTPCDEEALAIAGSMPELRHLHLIRNYMTNDGLTAILDACPHLQSLDLLGCFNLDLAENISNRLEHIKNVRLPRDSTVESATPFGCDFDEYNDADNVFAAPADYDEYIDDIGDKLADSNDDGNLDDIFVSVESLRSDGDFMNMISMSLEPFFRRMEEPQGEKFVG